VTLDLPPHFIRNVIAAFGDAGRRYLADLPTLLDQASQRWGLSVGKRFLLSYNYVCAVTRSNGTPAVLKVGVPNLELNSEINALRVYRGQGACQLLEADPETGMLLLERLLPGRMLVDVKDDDLATGIAADVVKNIQRQRPEGEGFLSLQGWFAELDNLRSRFGGGTGPFPERTVDIVNQLLHELFSDVRPPMLLHGDFHHYNILSSTRGWLVIDPKGVIGAPEYEAAPLLLNPLGQTLDEAEAIIRTQRRIAILSERLGFDPSRIWRWAVCHSLLSAWWDVAEDGTLDETARRWPEILLKIRF
jgi:streptomycin 6-kinase